MDKSQVDAYLARIGAERPERPDAAALRVLQRAHLGAVPFENLSIHLGEPVLLTEEALLAKVVDRRRGGFCYELNGAFAALLTALGYRVTLLGGRVFFGERLGSPMDHLALRVDLDEPWLVDVGFGRFSHGPLRLDERGDQQDTAGVFRLSEHGEDLDVLQDGSLQYRLEPRAFALADFGPTCWWQTTSPESHFTKGLTCSLLTEDGRVTLSGTRLIRTAGEERQETELGEPEALEAYRKWFGIALDRLPVAPPAPAQPAG
ncbi:arylamine N-acetyltransferase [Kitasatospora sp. NBC_00240]|uniref:arylamine N-acetyltransferase family protein n=1 Tax=Kitasatospora sp. NBC_00240 TaxID=2903567 RepID=UPI002255677E|nr:arylamine N-acetyltransferase [Kitasatospora sp. NBC_00240]MCX5213797.1 arylamine N-acetyltransferase [Kitasatospora sp. NBC_00240]